VPHVVQRSLDVRPRLEHEHHDAVIGLTARFERAHAANRIDRLFDGCDDGVLDGLPARARVLRRDRDDRNVFGLRSPTAEQRDEQQQRSHDVR
jgi:hypothetical protein